jgi:hypothetical protein
VATNVESTDAHGRLPHAPVREPDSQLAMGMIKRIGLVSHEKLAYVKPDIPVSPQKMCIPCLSISCSSFRLSHDVSPSDLCSPSCLPTTSHNFYSNARLARRLLGGLADVDKLGLDRRSTDEEPVDIGLLGCSPSSRSNRKERDNVRTSVSLAFSPRGA